MKCITCKKSIKSKKAKRCMSCANRIKATRHGLYLTKSFCIDCNKKLSKPIYRRCLLCSNKLRYGTNNSAYIDGRTDLRKLIRMSPESKKWRLMIFERDNYTCQDCDQIGGKLEAHHIILFQKLFNKFLKEYDQFSLIEDKEILYRISISYKPFWDLQNGKTLCEKCHGKYPKGDRVCQEIHGQLK